MNAFVRALWLLTLPALWLGALLFAALLLLIDLACWPFVAARRRPDADRAPPTRNASIVVLNWNGLGFLRDLMPSLQLAVQRCPGDHEVIVVDNGSDDGSAEWLAAHHAWAKLVRLPENRFFIRGNAAGAALASRDILVYLNNDMRVEPDWLVELLRPFGDPDLFAVSSRIEMQAPRKETGFTRCFVKHGELRLVQPPGTPGAPTPVLWAGGGSSAFDRQKHDTIGGFEGLYEPCYVEDVSLSWQAWRRGWRTVYAHDSVVHHAHRGTSTRVFGREPLERRNWRNRELFFVRSITDPRLVLQHALFLPWNLRKNARYAGVPLAHAVRAVFAAVPRLGAAINMRQAMRRVARRSDRQVLAQVPVPAGGEPRPRRPQLAALRPRLSHVLATRDDLDLSLLPSFLIVGPQRTGTTWLARNLGQHPQVFVPEREEIHYFNNLRHRGRWHPAHLPPVQPDLAWYLEQMRVPPAERARRERDCLRRFGRGFDPVMRGDGTASYAAALDHEVLGDLMLLNPDVKVVLMVRDPFERAWSHAKKEFEMLGRPIATVPDDELMAWLDGDYVQRCGRHRELLATWSAQVPAPNLFVGRFSHLQQRPRELLLELFRFLGVDADPRFVPADAGAVVNASPETPPPHRVQQHLATMFADERRWLADQGIN
ncbi:MAG: sulfotransferase [Planctomycetes bacterium]|nr:sulfotransferase [Planctomycetota bacterium]